VYIDALLTVLSFFYFHIRFGYKPKTRINIDLATHLLRYHSVYNRDPLLCHISEIINAIIIKIAPRAMNVESVG